MNEKLEREASYWQSVVEAIVRASTRKRRKGRKRITAVRRSLLAYARWRVVRAESLLSGCEPPAIGEALRSY
jgi:hypothetical protein